MSELECVSGNTSHCQTPHVLRQSTYELKRKAQLHRDMVTELMFQRQASEIENEKIQGYIQLIGQFPFYVSVSTEQQAKMFSSLCRNNADTIAYIIKRFMADVRTVGGGFNVQPGLVVIDLSYALMNALMDALNHSTLQNYLRFVYQVMSGHCSTTTVRSHTFVGLCIAHMMKTLSVRLKSVKKNQPENSYASVCYFGQNVVARTGRRNLSKCLHSTVQPKHHACRNS